jgi:hypothetical protein
MKVATSTLHDRQLRADPSFRERLAEYLGPGRVRKLRRDSRESRERYLARIAEHRKAEAARAAVNRLERILS